MRATFVELPAFERHRMKYLTEEEFARLQDALMQDPLVGDVIEGTGGVRKMRYADQRRNKGKRGGLRILYYWWAFGNEFWLYMVYDKSEMNDVNAMQRAALKESVKRELKLRYWT